MIFVGHALAFFEARQKNLFGLKNSDFFLTELNRTFYVQKKRKKKEKTFYFSPMYKFCTLLDLCVNWKINSFKKRGEMEN